LNIKGKGLWHINTLQGLGVRVLVFNATFNNIAVTSWMSVLLVEEIGVHADSAGFTYRLDRLKPRASTFRGPPVKVYIFNTVIELSHLCCHNILYFLNNQSGIFLTQLHSISEYCRILNTPHRLRLY
jgi:hypothetical protein